MILRALRSVTFTPPQDPVPVWDALPAWLQAAGVLLAATAVALVVHRVLTVLVRRGLPDLQRQAADEVTRYAVRPLGALLVAGACYLMAAGPLMPGNYAPPVRHAALVAVILATAWLLVGAAGVFQLFVEAHYRTDRPDNLKARRVQTKVRMLRRIAVVVVGFLAAAGVMLTFPSVRRVGISLFASAGVLGIVVGVAAQPTLSNLVAGLQVALAEPIRIDDVVIVEGEWGWVEEIGTTFVVIRIWDLRRLVVPLRYFVEHPFENWTRQTADILGSVMLYVDPSVPVDGIRDEARRLVTGNELWDDKVISVQVVDVTERAQKVRVLVSAADSPSAWDLRCQLREALLAYLRREHPEAFPRVRAEVTGPRAEAVRARPTGGGGPVSGPQGPTGSSREGNPVQTDQA